MRSVEIYDTTLRDGAQAEDISLLVEDKLRITQKLDELGVDYIKGDGRGRIRRTSTTSRRFRHFP